MLILFSLNVRIIPLCECDVKPGSVNYIFCYGIWWDPKYRQTILNFYNTIASRLLSPRAVYVVMMYKAIQNWAEIFTRECCCRGIICAWMKASNAYQCHRLVTVVLYSIHIFYLIYVHFRHSLHSCQFMVPITMATSQSGSSNTNSHILGWPSNYCHVLALVDEGSFVLLPL